jgi:hypothetical protein
VKVGFTSSAPTTLGVKTADKQRTKKEEQLTKKYVDTVLITSVISTGVKIELMCILVKLLLQQVARCCNNCY